MTEIATVHMQVDNSKRLLRLSCISFVGAPFINERTGTSRKRKLRHGQATWSAIKRRIRGRVHIFLIERAHRKKKQNETAAVVSVPMGI